MCGVLEGESPPEGRVEMFQEAVGVKTDGQWGPISRAAHAALCEEVWEGWNLPYPKWSIEADGGGFRIHRRGEVGGATSYQYRMAKTRQELRDAAVYNLPLEETGRAATGLILVQARSCNPAACSDQWSNIRTINAAPTATSLNKPRTAPVRRNATTTTTQSKAYQCEYMAQSFDRAVRAEAYEYATSLLEEMYKMGC